MLNEEEIIIDTETKEKEEYIEENEINDEEEDLFSLIDSMYEEKGE